MTAVPVPDPGVESDDAKSAIRATYAGRGRENPESTDGGRSLLDELMTARQVAELLQMRISTVETYARRGLLPSVKVGRHRRFIRSQLERALTALTDGGVGRTGRPLR
jgi:excisionase family DNA binding protein